MRNVQNTCSQKINHLKINSLINPLDENMIRACGALLKYLDKNSDQMAN